MVWHPAEANVGGYRGSIQVRSEPAGRDQRLGLGREGKAYAGLEAMWSGLTPKRSRAKRARRCRIPNDEREHAVEPLEEGGIHALVQRRGRPPCRSAYERHGLVELGPSSRKL